MNHLHRIAIFACAMIVACAAGAQPPDDRAERERQAALEAEMQALIAEQVEMRRRQAQAAEQQAGTQQQAAEQQAIMQQQLARQVAAQQQAVLQLAQLDQQREAQLIQLQQAREQLEVARTQVEQAAQQIAVAEVPVASRDAMTGLRWLFNPRTGSRAQLGAVVVDADGGVLVTQLSPGGAAAEAGVKVGDLVHAIDDVDLAADDGSAYAKVNARLAELEPGDTVRLAIERGGAELAVDVVTRAGSDFFAVNLDQNRNRILFSNGEMRELPASAGPIVLSTVNDGSGPVTRVLNFAVSPWGSMELVPMTEGLSRYFDTAEGLLVVRGPADETIGLADGDVILSIGGRTPNSPEHAIRILGSFEAGETIELSIMRGGRRDTIEYVVPEQPAWLTPGAYQRLAPSAPAAPTAAAAPGSSATPAPADPAAAPVVPLVVEPAPGR